MPYWLCNIKKSQHNLRKGSSNFLVDRMYLVVFKILVSETLSRDA